MLKMQKLESNDVTLIHILIHIFKMYANGINYEHFPYLLESQSFQYRSLFLQAFADSRQMPCLAANLVLISSADSLFTTTAAGKLIANN